jgi:hypothetical protein
VAAVAGLVAPGGTLLAVENVRTGPLSSRPRGPSAMRRSRRSPSTGYDPVRIEQLDDGIRRWRAEFSAARIRT